MRRAGPGEGFAVYGWQNLVPLLRLNGSITSAFVNRDILRFSCQWAEGPVLLHVGTAFVTPTEGQEYDPTDGAVTVPTGFPDVPKVVLGCVAGCLDTTP
jgi:hypothetical protein